MFLFINSIIHKELLQSPLVKIIMRQYRQKNDIKGLGMAETAIRSAYGNKRK